jgi:hypothetical protein
MNSNEERVEIKYPVQWKSVSFKMEWKRFTAIFHFQ